MFKIFVKCSQELQCPSSVKRRSIKIQLHNSGQLILHNVRIKTEPTFLDYIQNETKLIFIVAVDFTASNGNPSNSNPLYYNDPTCAPNQYITAIQPLVISFKTMTVTNFSQCWILEQDPNQMEGLAIISPLGLQMILHARAYLAFVVPTKQPSRMSNFIDLQTSLLLFIMWPEGGASTDMTQATFLYSLS